VHHLPSRQAAAAARDPAIAAILKQTDATWHATIRGLLKHAQAEGSVDAALDPNATAALVTATFRGIFMFPIETTTSQRAQQSLTQLERFLGIRKSS